MRVVVNRIVRNEGTILVAEGTRLSDNAMIWFAGDRRPMEILASALDDGEEVEVDIEVWQLIPVQSESKPTTKVVNLRVARYDVYIGRKGRGQDGYFGNPFRLMADTPAERDVVIKAYTVYFNNRIKEDAEFRERIQALKGKTLGCFCKPKACHGDVIVAYLEG